MKKDTFIAPDDRRAQILQIALKKFATNGYHMTKVSDIVREAGVAQGTFYWHFKSKEALALEIIETGRVALLDVIQQGYRQQPGDIPDMVRASETLFCSLFMFAADNRYLMELLLKGNGVEETVRLHIVEVRQAMEQAFRRNIERAMELGMLPPTLDVELRAALLMGLLEGLISRWLFGSEELHQTIALATAERLAAEAANFEFYGLLGKPGEQE